MKDFTRFQLRFIDNYIADPNRNPAEAATKAGLDASAGGDLIQMEHIQDEIKFRLERRRNPAGKAASITKDDLEDMVLQIIKRCMQKVEIIDRAGRRTGVYKFMPIPALKGIEVFAKLRGYADKNLDAVKGISSTPSLTVQDLLPLIKECTRILAEQNDIIIMQPADITQEIEDEKRPDPVTKTVPGEDVSQVPADATISARSIDEFMKQQMQKKILDE